MDNRTGLFCSLLKAGLWNETLDIHLDKDEFKSVWNDATRQVTRGLIASALVSSNAVPPKVVDRLQDQLLKIAGENLKMGSVLTKSVSALRKEGIEPVLLKGHGVASYYKVPMLRESGDIDLYVGQENYRKAFDSLDALSDAPESFVFEEKEKHSHVEINGILIELHQYSDVLSPKYDPTYQRISDDCLRGSFVTLQLDDCSVSTPEATFNALYIFNHIWSHYVAAGVGFRQICDWTMFLHANRDAIDIDKLARMLDALDMLKPWKVFGVIAVDLLGLPASEMPFYDDSVRRLASKVLRMIMKEGNFGHEWKARWSESGNRHWDTFRHFFIISWRYAKVIPMFGDIAFQEYKSKIISYL